MNVNNNNIEMKATKTICRNPLTAQYEEVFPEDEITNGETVIIMYWSNTTQHYEAIPGASYYTVTANGLQLIQD